MIPARRPLPSLGSLLQDMLFLVRMRASERRFRRHDAAWRRLRVAENKHLDVMTAEVELRAGLCQRRAADRAGQDKRLTVGGVASVRLPSCAGAD